jgi:hypothetical protein
VIIDLAIKDLFGFDIITVNTLFPNAFFSRKNVDPILQINNNNNCSMG